MSQLSTSIHTSPRFRASAHLVSAIFGPTPRAPEARTTHNRVQVMASPSHPSGGLFNYGYRSVICAGQEGPRHERRRRADREREIQFDGAARISNGEAACLPYGADDASTDLDRRWYQGNAVVRWKLVSFWCLISYLSNIVAK